jgi:hypothetical protein
MSFVKCGVDGCNKKLYPALKPDPRDRETRVYPECSANASTVIPRQTM